MTERFETSSTTKFPYHRFDVKWMKYGAERQGGSAVAREFASRQKVSMFAWNWASKRWETLAFHVAKDGKPLPSKEA
ncbi:hypothetical protein PO124_11965 [Bacillus licheniformis]|nr:hypothetical protein [Bacillus licheniformis]